MYPDMVNALQAIASMLERSRRAQMKFAQGTPQHTLQKNRIKALCIASEFIKKELMGSAEAGYTKEDLEAATRPLASLISKSEKARQKLAHGTWQHTMLENNLQALYIALPLIRRELDVL